MRPSLAGYPSYELALVAAVVVSVGWTLVIARRAKVPIKYLFLVQTFLGLAAFTGGRLHAVLSALGSDASIQAFVAGSRIRYPGAILGVFAATPLVSRLSRGHLTARSFGDIIAAPIALAMGITRIGCFLHGCCYGVITTLPWGIQMPKSSLPWLLQSRDGLIEPTAELSFPVHPLPLYFAVWSFLVAVVLARRLPRRSFDGEVFLWFLILHEGGKFALELLRAPRPVPHLFLPSLALGFIGVALLAYAPRAQATGAN